MELKNPMQRPASLPPRDDSDRRTPEQKEAAKRAAACFSTPYDGSPLSLRLGGMIGTPTPEMQAAVDASIARKLALRRKRAAVAADVIERIGTDGKPD